MPDVFGQPTLDERNKRREENRQAIACINSGGRWDKNRKICIPKEQVQRELKEQEDKKKGKEELPKTNDPALQLAREKGIPIKEAAAILAQKGQQSPQKQLLNQSLVNTQNEADQREAAAIADQQFAQQQAAQGETAPIELGTNNPLSTAATVAAAGGGALVGAKAGAALGTVVAPGVGTIVGGIIGGIGGAIGGAYTKLSIQEKQDVKKADQLWKKAKTNKNEILNMVNSGLLTEGRARALWAEEKANISLAHSYLKEQTSNDLKDFLGSPGDELINIEAYLQLDSEYDLEFERALLNPDPRRVVFIPQESQDNG